MARKTSKTENIEQDMTPMIDIVFQLVVFFVLVNDFSNLESVADITIPYADALNLKKYKEKLTVNVDKDGRVKIAGNVYGEEALKGHLQGIARQYPSAEDPTISDLLVYIRGDTDAQYVHVQKVMYLAQHAGLWKISFAAQKKL